MKKFIEWLIAKNEVSHSPQPYSQWTIEEDDEPPIHCKKCGMSWSPRWVRENMKSDEKKTLKQGKCPLCSK